MKAKSKDSSLSQWVSENEDELRFVSEYGSNDTIRAQAEAMLNLGLKDDKKRKNRDG